MLGESARIASDEQKPSQPATASEADQRSPRALRSPAVARLQRGADNLQTALARHLGGNGQAKEPARKRKGGARTRRQQEGFRALKKSRGGSG